MEVKNVLCHKMNLIHSIHHLSFFFFLKSLNNLKKMNYEKVAYCSQLQERIMYTIYKLNICVEKQNWLNVFSIHF